MKGGNEYFSSVFRKEGSKEQLKSLSLASVDVISSMRENHICYNDPTRQMQS
jgi:hypothetical protein